MYSYKVLQNWTQDLFHSSLLIFDKQSYLFNCSDGTQRNALDQGIKFTKIGNIFYSYSHIDAYLGTYGFLMSRNEQITGQLISHDNAKTKTPGKLITKHKEPEAPIKNVTLWGPPLMSRNFEFCKNFFTDTVMSQIREFDISTNSFNDPIGKVAINKFEDENLTIIPICICGGNSSNSSDVMINFTENLNKNDFAMSYICIPHQKKPMFLPSKAQALGLKPGPNYSKLQNGQSVFLENLREIRPEDVLGTPNPSSCVCIFFVPTTRHAYNLTQNDDIKQLLAPSKSRKISLMIHIMPVIEILEEDFYQKFICQFGGDTIHLIDCKESNNKFLYNEGKLKVKSILNKIDGKLFQNDFFTLQDCSPAKEISNLKNIDYLKSMISITQCNPGFEYLLYPLERKGIIKAQLYSNPYYYQTEAYATFSEEVDKILKVIQEEEFQTESGHMDDDKTICLSSSTSAFLSNSPNILFLGTTSMKPGKYRNVSSILVQLPSNLYFMMDCGEGTYQQLYEHFGRAICDEVLLKIKIIFLTHKHGDHMLGTLKLLSEIDKCKAAKYSNSPGGDMDDIIFIIAPNTILHFLCNSIQLDLEYKNQIILIDCSKINPNCGSVYGKYIKYDDPMKLFQDVQVLDETEISEQIKAFRTNTPDEITAFFSYSEKYLGLSVYAVEVFHCDESYGCVFEEYQESKVGETKWKISYSGDTRPCNNFLNYAYKSSICIHEATFDDNFSKDAQDKMHSTFNEAISIGKMSNSWRVALTHFSPRYIKTCSWNEEYDTQQVIFVHDFLSCRLIDFEHAYRYLKKYDKLITSLEKKNKFQDS